MKRLHNLWMSHCNILGKKIPINYKDLKGENMGLYHPCKRYIEIEEKLKGNDLKLTLIHEQLHAICDILNIQIPLVLEEILCDIIADQILENFDVRLKAHLKQQLDESSKTSGS